MIKKYINRVLEKAILDYLKIFPVVEITGPRQSGKSTLVEYLLKDEYVYVSFDDFKIRDFFYNDPEKFMETYSNKVIFDEVQNVPELFTYIKLAVDRDRDNYGKFVVTGSNQFSLLKSISESLAGRIGLLSLLPFQFTEMPKSLRDKSVFRGGYPELVTRDYDYCDEWYSAYLDTYLEKDVRVLHNVGDLRDFRRFITLLAGNASNLLNMSRFASDIGVSVSTIKRWLSILEASYIIFLLPPYFKNLGKRLVKSPKVYFYDTGLVAYLTGIATKEIYEKGPMFGALFENYVVSEIVKNSCHKKLDYQFYFLRTSSGEEIDLIIDKKQSKEFIEIKTTSTFKTRMVKTIENYLAHISHKPSQNLDSTVHQSLSSKSQSLISNNVSGICENKSRQTLQQSFVRFGEKCGLEKDDSGFLLYQGKDFPYHGNIKIINYKNYLLSS